MGGVSQGTAFACPEPRRFHEASGSVVSVAPPRMSRSGLPDAPFFRFIGGIAEGLPPILIAGEPMAGFA